MSIASPKLIMISMTDEISQLQHHFKLLLDEMQKSLDNLRGNGSNQRGDIVSVDGFDVGTLLPSR